MSALDYSAARANADKLVAVLSGGDSPWDDKELVRERLDAMNVAREIMAANYEPGTGDYYTRVASCRAWFGL